MGSPKELIGASAHSLAEMIAATPSCMKIIDGRGRLLTMNAQGLALIEAEDLGSVLGADVYELVAESHRDAFVAFNEQVCAGERGELVFEIVGLKGTRRWMETYAAPYRLTNGDIAHIAITNDITKKVEAEEELRSQRQALASAARLASLGEFASGVAHEINNPLAVVLGKLSLLEMDASEGTIEPDALLEELRKIIRTTERISTIIDNLKKFSRSSNDEPIRSSSVEGIVADTLSLCHERFRINRIDVQVDIEPNLRALCQEAQLSQVLMNLINNSFDAVRTSRERWLRIEASSAGARARIAVTDSGPGIPQEVADHMLEPFFTTKPLGEGTGLGLSLSVALLAACNGTLTYNRSHDNTQFVIELPLGDDQDVEHV